jgi:hypothetical protein
VKYEGVSAGLAIERPAAAVVVLRLTGWDTGEFGDAAMKGASVDVSNDWALWLRANRARFAHVSMLTGAPFVQLTAKFVQRFADLGEIMRIYTDAPAFDASVRTAVNSGSGS